VSNHRLIRLKNLSHKLVSSCVFSFVNSLYLILHACVQTSDVIGVKVYCLELNGVFDVGLLLNRSKYYVIVQVSIHDDIEIHP
jgi:hypothetical protein